MKKNNYGLSLIELLITITISMILMASIGIFMSSGLSNIFLQEKNVGNILKINQISAKINQVLDLIEQKPIILEKDKIVFKVKNNFDFGGYATIATQEKDDFCENSAIRTNHLYLKNFVPILDEEQKLTYTLSDGIYTTNQKENKVYKENEVFIGKSVYGDEILENDAFLNRPTGIAVKDNEVFVSDSLNDRVLKIIEENGQKKVIKILGKEDGILKPTYLKINENGNLEITSSGNNKKYELVFGNFPTNISYSEELKEKDGKIKVNFLKDGENLTTINLQELFEEEGLEIDENGKIILNTNSNPLTNKQIIEKLEKIKNKITNKITEKGNYSTSVKLENENEKQTYYERFLFSVYGNNLKLIGDYNEDLTNILKNTTFDENYDEILNIPIESLEISLDGDYLNFVLKYYKNFNCEDLESNKDKIQTLFLKKKVK